jgi:hypothetical protein
MGVRRWLAWRGVTIVAAALLCLALGGPLASAEESSVLTYHGRPDRSGNFVVPALSWAKARSLHLDPAFHAEVAGQVYAQPLYWEEPGSRRGVVIVATENDEVFALDAATGRQVWKKSLGTPVRLGTLPCGNIDPDGITGTPVIDARRQALYLDALVERASGPTHLAFALSLKDGSILRGWPVDLASALGERHEVFDPRTQGERGAVAILHGTLYIPFGGNLGDCGTYHGWVVGIPLGNPKSVLAWRTRAKGGGIWAPGGIASDGKSLFVATGNTFDAAPWGDGEAVMRLAPDLHRTEMKRDFFAPKDWPVLDREDADLGATNPLLLKVTTDGVTEALILALGKDRHAYLLDAENLGGIGGELANMRVSKTSILTAPAVYPARDGAMVAFRGEGASCPHGARSGDLTVLDIRAGKPPRISTAWCGDVSGGGAPIVTTTDGHSDPVVWMLGAQGDNRLHGFRGDTGEPLFTSAPLAGLRHFQTLIATRNRLYVGADGRVYAFAF